MGIEVLPPDVNTLGLRLRRRRREDPLRPDRRQGRGGGRGARDRARRATRAARSRSVWDICERVDAQAAQQARAREPDQVRRARLDRRVAPRDAGGVRDARSRPARRRRPTSSGARARSSTSASRSRRALQSGRHHPQLLEAEFDRRELLALEKETLGLYLTSHPLAEVRDQLRRKVDLPLAELLVRATRARSSPSAGSSRACARR